MTLSFNASQTYAEQLDGLYLAMAPAGFPGAKLLWLNTSLAHELGFDVDTFKADAADFIAGNVVPQGASPLAQAYAGHQFGHFSPQLGDGRALLLGEVLDRHGKRRDVQLKGSGRTPFSRGGDGLAPLSPALREALVSEAMFALGVPTTRMLGVVQTQDTVIRRRAEPGAVLARVAASHLRIGTIEFFAARSGGHPGPGLERLQRLVDYAAARHDAARLDGDNSAASVLLTGVIKRQAQLVAHWQSLGFVHGVMNTDNVTLSGETIDYGPCAFMNATDLDTVFSSIDRHGRYAFGRQPEISVWNMMRLASALLPLSTEPDKAAIATAEAAVAQFEPRFRDAYLGLMSAKLGLQEADSGGLVDDLIGWMAAGSYDYTDTFRQLADHLRGRPLPGNDPTRDAWVSRWKGLLTETGQPTADRMDAVNPLYIPRNDRVEAVLDAAVAGDIAPFNEMLAAVSAPFEARPEHAAYAGPPAAGTAACVTFCGT